MGEINPHGRAPRLIMQYQVVCSDNMHIHTNNIVQNKHVVFICLGMNKYVYTCLCMCVSMQKPMNRFWKQD